LNEERDRIRGALVPWPRVVVVSAAYVAIAVAIAVSPDRSWGRVETSRSEVIRGAGVWREANCAACHALFGLGGQLGPDLTDVLSAKGELYVRASLPGGRPGMPAFDLTPAETDALVAYLGQVDASGEYPLRKRPLRAFGSIP
jgi:mono/diheme cytochrome c family protein